MRGSDSYKIVSMIQTWQLVNEVYWAVGDIDRILKSDHIFSEILCLSVKHLFHFWNLFNFSKTYTKIQYNTQAFLYHLYGHWIAPMTLLKVIYIDRLFWTPKGIFFSNREVLSFKNLLYLRWNSLVFTADLQCLSHWLANSSQLKGSGDNFFAPSKEQMD